MRWGRMSIVALILVTASFTWLGMLLSDRSVARTGPIASAIRSQVAEPSSQSEIEQRAAVTQPSVDSASTPVAASSEVSAQSQLRSSTDAATPGVADESSDASSAERDSQRLPAGADAAANATPRALASSVQPEPAAVGSQSSGDQARSQIDPATASEQPRSPVSQPSRTRAPTRESRRHAAPVQGKADVAQQQQWELLQPPAQPPSASVAAPRLRGNAGAAQGQSQGADTPGVRRSSGLAESQGEPTNSTTATFDNDPERRERWLRDQLQIR